MQFELLCAATLAARARCRIAGVGDPSGDLLPAHPAFLGVRRLRFGFEEGPAPGAGATSAVEWLEDLRDEGLVGITLDTIPVPLIRTRLDDGDLAWEVLSLGSGATVVGRREPAPAPEPSDLQRLAEELRGALAAAQAPTEPVLLRRLAIAQAILESPLDGQEVADTAWPHFILPEAADPARRRLLAAAATVLPDTGPAPPAEAIDADLEAVALRSLAGAVNA